LFLAKLRYVILKDENQSFGDEISPSIYTAYPITS